VEDLLGGLANGDRATLTALTESLLLAHADAHGIDLLATEGPAIDPAEKPAARAADSPLSP
jgi:hypothetical protein